ncbi:hypothetical protein RND71_018973 [Anisodus tanguticus]|uniref:Uncharacterized protein n=1 Tax=Anisodus tanguticus TaxID=243964 RepID=A0AAE1S5T2_9SOLA|nr:hypothetical protein RND71_018973 [Anisodus tanguticus]
MASSCSVNSPVPLTETTFAEETSTGVGVIDAEFEDGYLITVMIGSEKCKGVLYKIPVTQELLNQNPPTEEAESAITEVNEFN